MRSAVSEPDPVTGCGCRESQTVGPSVRQSAKRNRKSGKNGSACHRQRSQVWTRRLRSVTGVFVTGSVRRLEIQCYRYIWFSQLPRPRRKKRCIVTVRLKGCRQTVIMQTGIERIYMFFCFLERKIQRRRLSSQLRVVTASTSCVPPPKANEMNLELELRTARKFNRRTSLKGKCTYQHFSQRLVRLRCLKT